MLEKLLNKFFFVNCLNTFLDDSMDKLMDQNCTKFGLIWLNHGLEIPQIQKNSIEGSRL